MMAISIPTLNEAHCLLTTTDKPDQSQKVCTDVKTLNCTNCLVKISGCNICRG